MPRVRVKDFGYVSLKKYDGMMGRCYRPSDKSFVNYGGRGIRVCSSWIRDINSFRCWLLAELERQDITVEQFVKNSGKIQLDRIDPEGHYIPENCRLVSAQQNSRNQRRAVNLVYLSAEGEEISVRKDTGVD